jgi:hypothetical protein
MANAYTSIFTGDPDFAALPRDFAPLADASIRADLRAMLATRFELERAAAESMLDNPAFDILATSTFRQVAAGPPVLSAKKNLGPQAGRVPKALAAAVEAGSSVDRAIDGAIAALTINHNDWRWMLRRREANPAPLWRSPRFAKWYLLGSLLPAAVIAILIVWRSKYEPLREMRAALAIDGLAFAFLEYTAKLYPIIALSTLLGDRLNAYAAALSPRSLGRRIAAMQFLRELRHARPALAKRVRTWRVRAHAFLCMLFAFYPVAVLYVPFIDVAQKHASFPAAVERWRGAMEYLAPATLYFIVAMSIASTVWLVAGPSYRRLRQAALKLAEADSEDEDN